MPPRCPPQGMIAESLATGGFRIGLVTGGGLGIFRADGLLMEEITPTGEIRILQAGFGYVTGLNAKAVARFSNTVPNGISTQGLGLSPLYGLDNRSGLTAPDGAAITLYAVPAGAGQVFRVMLHIDATAFTSGTATYTLTWTENGVAKTLVVTATALNTPGMALGIIKPDASTNVTVQLTGTFTATLTVAASVEQLA